MKLLYRYMTIFVNLSPSSSHLYPLQVENCESNSRLVVDEDDNGKFRHKGLTRVIMPFSDFDDDRDADNIGFIIKRIKVHSDPTEPGYKFPDDYGVETYLELFSEDNYDAFCLAYMFTHRDFEGGTLGLAWTGDLQNAGGVCEKNGVRIKFLKSNLKNHSNRLKNTLHYIF